MNYRRIKASIQRMMDQSYPDFIQALISVEIGIDYPERLKETYNDYINDDEINLLNSDLIKHKEEYEW